MRNNQHVIRLKQVFLDSLFQTPNARPVDPPHIAKEPDDAVNMPPILRAVKFCGRFSASRELESAQQALRSP